MSLYRLNKLLLTKLFYNCGPQFLQFKNIQTSIYKRAEIRNYLESLSFDDSRLQNYLKSLRNDFINFRKDENIPYNYEYLKNISCLLKDIEAMKAEVKELDNFVTEIEEKEDELLTVAQEEKTDLEKKLETLKSAVLQCIVPDEVIDDKDIILELSPGVGGQEAMLFTKDMFDMYCKFIHWKGWTYQILKYDETGIGGLRNGHIAVFGKNAYKIFKYECGVHRVQRIPKTEKAGRIHTSTMTVAVLPQPSDIDVVINPNDIQLEFKRSGGAGGQHVNTTDSCVRIYHKPSGIVVESQMERNQHRNRELAMKSLRAKLYERELEKITKETSSARKVQIGTAARSEKIRTYNFVQDRITDHRAHITMHGVESFFHGELLNRLVNSLQEWYSSNKLMDILQKYES